jgi:acyl carrier protein
MTTDLAEPAPGIAYVPPLGAGDELRSFITENFLFGQDDVCLTGDTSFLEGGIIDSTGILELIAFLERTYGIRLTDQELVPENLDSLNRLTAFISRKVDAQQR